MAPPRRPWAKEVGQATTFYLEGGHGERYWSGGWHYGIIRALPIKGSKKGWAQIEIPVPRWAWDNTKRKYVPKALERAWVSAWNVNEPGDFSYHGPKLKDEVRGRAEDKAEQQAKADKKIRRVKV